MWPDHQPASVAFCDVESTGVGVNDRIVSFGGIGMISRNLMTGQGDLKYVYLVFDPGTENRPGAERVHGFSDLTLRLQDPFTLMPPRFAHLSPHPINFLLPTTPHLTSNSSTARCDWAACRAHQPWSIAL